MNSESYKSERGMTRTPIYERVFRQRQAASRDQNSSMGANIQKFEHEGRVFLGQAFSPFKSFGRSQGYQKKILGGRDGRDVSVVGGNRNSNSGTLSVSRPRSV